MNVGVNGSAAGGAIGTSRGDNLSKKTEDDVEVDEALHSLSNMQNDQLDNVYADPALHRLRFSQYPKKEDDAPLTKSSLESVTKTVSLYNNLETIHANISNVLAFAVNEDDMKKFNQIPGYTQLTGADPKKASTASAFADPNSLKDFLLLNTVLGNLKVTQDSSVSLMLPGVVNVNAKGIMEKAENVIVAQIADSKAKYADVLTNIRNIAKKSEFASVSNSFVVHTSRNTHDAIMTAVRDEEENDQDDDDDDDDNDEDKSTGTGKQQQQQHFDNDVEDLEGDDYGGGGGGGEEEDSEDGKIENSNKLANSMRAPFIVYLSEEEQIKSRTIGIKSMFLFSNLADNLRKLLTYMTTYCYDRDISQWQTRQVKGEAYNMLDNNEEVSFVNQNAYYHDYSETAHVPNTFAKVIYSLLSQTTVQTKADGSLYHGKICGWFDGSEQIILTETTTNIKDAIKDVAFPPRTLLESVFYSKKVMDDLKKQLHDIDKGIKGNDYSVSSTVVSEFVKSLSKYLYFAIIDHSLPVVETILIHMITHPNIFVKVIRNKFILGVSKVSVLDLIKHLETQSDLDEIVNEDRYELDKTEELGAKDEEEGKKEEEEEEGLTSPLIALGNLLGRNKNDPIFSFESVLRDQCARVMLLTNKLYKIQRASLDVDELTQSKASIRRALWSFSMPSNNLGKEVVAFLHSIIKNVKVTHMSKKSSTPSSFSMKNIQGLMYDSLFRQVFAGFYAARIIQNEKEITKFIDSYFLECTTRTFTNNEAEAHCDRFMLKLKGSISGRKSEIWYKVLDDSLSPTSLGTTRKLRNVIREGVTLYARRKMVREFLKHIIENQVVASPETYKDIVGFMDSKSNDFKEQTKRFQTLSDFYQMVSNSSELTTLQFGLIFLESTDRFANFETIKSVTFSDEKENNEDENDERRMSMLFDVLFEGDEDGKHDLEKFKDTLKELCGESYKKRFMLLFDMYHKGAKLEERTTEKIIEAVCKDYKTNVLYSSRISKNTTPLWLSVIAFRCKEVSNLISFRSKVFIPQFELNDLAQKTELFFTDAFRKTPSVKYLKRFMFKSVNVSSNWEFRPPKPRSKGEQSKPNIEHIIKGYTFYCHENTFSMSAVRNNWMSYAAAHLTKGNVISTEQLLNDVHDHVSEFRHYSRDTKTTVSEYTSSLVALARLGYLPDNGCDRYTGVDNKTVDIKYLLNLGMKRGILRKTDRTRILDAYVVTRPELSDTIDKFSVFIFSGASATKQERKIWELYKSTQFTQCFDGFANLVNNTPDSANDLESLCNCVDGVTGYTTVLNKIGKILSESEDSALKHARYANLSREWGLATVNKKKNDKSPRKIYKRQRIVDGFINYHLELLCASIYIETAKEFENESEEFAPEDILAAMSSAKIERYQDLEIVIDGKDDAKKARRDAHDFDWIDEKFGITKINRLDKETESNTRSRLTINDIDSIGVPVHSQLSINTLVISASQYSAIHEKVSDLLSSISPGADYQKINKGFSALFDEVNRKDWVNIFALSKSIVLHAFILEREKIFESATEAYVNKVATAAEDMGAIEQASQEKAQAEKELKDLGDNIRNNANIPIDDNIAVQIKNPREAYSVVYSPAEMTPGGSYKYLPFSMTPNDMTFAILMISYLQGKGTIDSDEKNKSVYEVFYNFFRRLQHRKPEQNTANPFDFYWDMFVSLRHLLIENTGVKERLTGSVTKDTMSKKRGDGEGLLNSPLCDLSSSLGRHPGENYNPFKCQEWNTFIKSGLFMELAISMNSGMFDDTHSENLTRSKLTHLKNIIYDSVIKPHTSLIKDDPRPESLRDFDSKRVVAGTSRAKLLDQFIKNITQDNMTIPGYTENGTARVLQHLINLYFVRLGTSEEDAMFKCLDLKKLTKNLETFFGEVYEEVTVTSTKDGETQNRCDYTEFSDMAFNKVSFKIGGPVEKEVSINNAPLRTRILDMSTNKLVPIYSRGSFIASLEEASATNRRVGNKRGEPSREERDVFSGKGDISIKGTSTEIVNELSVISDFFGRILSKSGAEHVYFDQNECKIGKSYISSDVDELLYYIQKLARNTVEQEFKNELVGVLEFTKNMSSKCKEMKKKLKHTRALYPWIIEFVDYFVDSMNKLSVVIQSVTNSSTLSKSIKSIDDDYQKKKTVTVPLFVYGTGDNYFIGDNFLERTREVRENFFLVCDQEFSYCLGKYKLGSLVSRVGNAIEENTTLHESLLKQDMLTQAKSLLTNTIFERLYLTSQKNYGHVSNILKTVARHIKRCYLQFEKSQAEMFDLLYQAKTASTTSILTGDDTKFFMANKNTRLLFHMIEYMANDENSEVINMETIMEMRKVAFDIACSDMSDIVRIDAITPNDTNQLEELFRYYGTIYKLNPHNSNISDFLTSQVRGITESKLEETYQFFKMIIRLTDTMMGIRSNTNGYEKIKGRKDIKNLYPGGTRPAHENEESSSAIFSVLDTSFSKPGKRDVGMFIALRILEKWQHGLQFVTDSVHTLSSKVESTAQRNDLKRLAWKQIRVTPKVLEVCIAAYTSFVEERVNNASLTTDEDLCITNLFVRINYISTLFFDFCNGVYDHRTIIENFVEEIDTCIKDDDDRAFIGTHTNKLVTLSDIYENKISTVLDAMMNHTILKDLNIPSLDVVTKHSQKINEILSELSLSYRVFKNDMINDIKRACIALKVINSDTVKTHLPAMVNACVKFRKFGALKFIFGIAREIIVDMVKQLKRDDPQVLPETKTRRHTLADNLFSTLLKHENEDGGVLISKISLVASALDFAPDTYSRYENRVAVTNNAYLKNQVKRYEDACSKFGNAVDVFVDQCTRPLRTIPVTDVSLQKNASIVDPTSWLLPSDKQTSPWIFELHGNAKLTKVKQLLGENNLNLYLGHALQSKGASDAFNTHAGKLGISSKVTLSTVYDQIFKLFSPVSKFIDNPSLTKDMHSVITSAHCLDFINRILARGGYKPFNESSSSEWYSNFIGVNNKTDNVLSSWFSGNLVMCLFVVRWKILSATRDGTFKFAQTQLTPNLDNFLNPLVDRVVNALESKSLEIFIPMKDKFGFDDFETSKSTNLQKASTFIDQMISKFKETAPRKPKGKNRTTDEGQSGSGGGGDFVVDPDVLMNPDYE